MGHRLGDLATDGLGESFCLCVDLWSSTREKPTDVALGRTDWTKEDNPIVLVSDGFGAVTGFPCTDIIGRNCRFLQGPGTSPDSIEPLREALEKGEAVTKLVLNYRSDGHPFFNLINITPLKDSDGKVKFFLGGQTD
ncbi:PAS domain-containing protein, partial [Rhodotorula toruloides]